MHLPIGERGYRFTDVGRASPSFPNLADSVEILHIPSSRRFADHKVIANLRQRDEALLLNELQNPRASFIQQHEKLSASC